MMADLPNLPTQFREEPVFIAGALMTISQCCPRAAAQQSGVPLNTVPAIDTEVIAASLLQKGKRLAQAGQTAAALEVLCNLVSLSPQNAEAYFWKGLAEQELGDNDAALSSYRLGIDCAAQAGMQCAEMHLNMGNVLMRLNRQAEAIAEYRQAVFIDPTLAEAQWNLADALRLTGDTAAAEEHLQNCARLGFGKPAAGQPK